MNKRQFVPTAAITSAKVAARSQVLFSLRASRSMIVADVRKSDNGNNLESSSDEFLRPFVFLEDGFDGVPQRFSRSRVGADHPFPKRWRKELVHPEIAEDIDRFESLSSCINLCGLSMKVLNLDVDMDLEAATSSGNPASRIQKNLLDMVSQLDLSVLCYHDVTSRQHGKSESDSYYLLIEPQFILLEQV
ncbi:hypothetical protein Tco_0803007 [Tanacetum coccineum]|uniref:Uncharacterized protein n=1 Tax=Tanacetum coccineum TaxID=301880 RepID=A0ABQ5A0E1_9ASTR